MARRPSIKEKPALLDIDQDLEIDPDNLDVQWAELPMLMHKYGSALAKAEQLARDLDEKVKTTRSELVVEINNNPSAYGVEKATQATVEACYRMDRSYTKAKKAWIAAQLEVDTLRNVSFCLSAKRASLESLIRLLSMEYFSSSNEGGYLSDKLKKKRNTRRRIKDNMNKN